MNKVLLIGRLAADPEVRYTPAGKAVCAFPLAVSGRGENQVIFVDIIAWDKLAETCGNYLAKGRRVGVEGRLNVRRYETAEGQKRKVTEVIAAEVEFLDSPAKNGAAGNSAPGSFHGMGHDVIPDEDIPF